MLLQLIFDCDLLDVDISSVKVKQLNCFDIAFTRILIVLILIMSGNVHVNPGPVHANPAISRLTFRNLCDRKSLGFLHVNICSLLNSKHFNHLITLAHNANPDILAISES